MSKSPEDIPLQEKSSEAPAAKGQSSGPFVLSKVKAILILAFVIVLVIIIIVLAAVLGAERAERRARGGFFCSLSLSIQINGQNISEFNSFWRLFGPPLDCLTSAIKFDFLTNL